MRGRGVVVLSVIVGLVAALGASLIVGRGATQYRTEARVAILPSNTDPAYEAVYYETLSRGQIPLTLAEVVRGLSTPTDSATMDVRVIPETSVIVISSTGARAATVEDAVGRRLEAGISAVDALGLPFRLSVLSDGKGTSGPVPTSQLSRLIVLLGIGLVAGSAVYLAGEMFRRRLEAD